MTRPLSPEEMFPARAAGVAARRLMLSTGVCVRVAESGPADGAPVVMLHGWGASVYTFRHALEAFPTQALRAIAVDLRGFGLSERPIARGAYTTDAYRADLDALLDALQLERAALMGHSMGGGVALHYALRTPGRVTALALINPIGLVSIGALYAMRGVPRQLMELIGERLVPRWVVEFVLERLAFGDPSLVTPQDVDEYWAPTQVPGFMRGLRGSIDEFDWHPLTGREAAGLTIPSVVILGSQDRLVRGARRAAERLRGARVYTVPGGHCVNEERPGEVHEILGSFIRAHLPP